MQLYVDSEESFVHTAIILVTGRHQDFYNVKWVAFGKCRGLRKGWQKTCYIYKYENFKDFKPIPYTDLILYMGLPQKGPLFYKILKGEHRLCQSGRHPQTQLLSKDLSEAISII